MSDADIDKAIKEAQEFEAQDKKRKENVETINEADAFVFQTEKALNEVGDKVSDSDRSEVQANLDKVKELVAKVKGNEASASDSDIDELKAAKEKLMSSAQSVFTKMYEAAGAAAGAGAGQAGPDMGGFSGGAADQGAQSQNADDDVIDGNFREV
jgi:molecular chaperone DnaK